ncbi:MAG: hypothetical protein AAF351_07850 [Pseudomonadota bacterium]
MQIKNVPPAVIAAALTACALEAESLNSERIAERFGSYGVEVLSQTDGIRRSSLYSTDGDIKTCRTYAVVEFLDTSADNDAHAEILSGESIGKTFKSNDWTINKRTEYLGEIQVSAGNSDISTLMMLDGDTILATHVYRLILEKDTQSVEYARIIEVHHPNYLRVDELSQLFGDTLAETLTPAAIGEIEARILGKN